MRADHWRSNGNICFHKCKSFCFCLFSKYVRLFVSAWCLTDRGGCRKGRGGGGGGGHRPCRKAGEGAYKCVGDGEQQYAEMKGAGNRIELH